MMDFDSAFSGFMETVREDPRIGPSHISLYLAILFIYKNKGQLPVSAYSRNLMKQAKISASGTYHKCMRDLIDCGYIKYIPSYNPVLGSLIYIL